MYPAVVSVVDNLYLIFAGIIDTILIYEKDFQKHM